MSKVNTSRTLRKAEYSSVSCCTPDWLDNLDKNLALRLSKAAPQIKKCRDGACKRQLLEEADRSIALV